MNESTILTEPRLVINDDTVDNLQQQPYQQDIFTIVAISFVFVFTFIGLLLIWLPKMQ